MQRYIPQKESTFSWASKLPKTSEFPPKPKGSSIRSRAIATAAAKVADVPKVTDPRPTEQQRGFKRLHKGSEVAVIELDDSK